MNPTHEIMTISSSLASIIPIGTVRPRLDDPDFRRRYAPKPANPLMCPRCGLIAAGQPLFREHDIADFVDDLAEHHETGNPRVFGIYLIPGNPSTEMILCEWAKRTNSLLFPYDGGPRPIHHVAAREIRDKLPDIRCFLDERGRVIDTETAIPLASSSEGQVVL